MTRVAHIVWGLEIGGIETMLVSILNHQCRQCKVSLIVINDMVDSTLAARIDPQVEVIYLSRKRGSYNPLPIARLNIALMRIKPDVIHSHSFSIANYLLPQLRSKAVLTMHTTLTDGLSRAVLLKYRSIYAVSSAVKQMLQLQFGIESTVVYNGIDFQKIATCSQPKSHKPIRIVQVGRLITEKGHKTTLEALAMIKSHEWILDIIGSGAEEEHLKRIANDLGIASRVNFIGSRSQEYIFTNLHRYHILLQPSTAEGFGLSVIEAMAAKISVVVSDIDALSEVVADGEHGHLFHVGRADSLAEVIEQLICKPDSSDYLENSYLYALNRFSIEKSAADYINLYRQ